jgi:hypothetical protein
MGPEPIWTLWRKPGYPSCSLVAVSTELTGLYIFRRVRKIVKSDHWFGHVCSPVCPSVRVEQLDSQWMDFHQNLYFRFFGKSVEKIEV